MRDTHSGGTHYVRIHNPSRPIHVGRCPPFQPSLTSLLRVIN
jgi:hypothetical protein